MSQEPAQTRDVAVLSVPRRGRLASTGDLGEPYRLIDADGTVVEPVAVFLRELAAAGRSPSTLRSYGMDLLRWWPFPGRRRGVLGPRDAGRGPRFQLLDPADGKATAARDALRGCNRCGGAAAGSTESGDGEAD